MPRPSPEEMRKAESQMSDLQKAQSEGREQGHREAIIDRVAFHERWRMRNEIEKPQEYNDHRIINGIEISISWGGAVLDGFALYMPQVMSQGDSGVAHFRRDPEMFMDVGKDPEVAKKVFEFAVQEAEREPDVYKLNKKVKIYYLKEYTDFPYE